MGLGDEIMALGEAQHFASSSGGSVAILDKAGQPRWHDLWQGESRIAQTLGPGVFGLVNGSGCRPYINYAHSTVRRWAFKESYRARRAQLPWVVPDARGAGKIIVEPRTKPNASPNKQWGRWLSLIGKAPHLPWAQIGPMNSPAWLPGVARIETASFQEAVNVLAGARAAVLPEGGLHHAAAAVGLPAVVLFGAYIPAGITGYSIHRNLAINDPDGVGHRVLHPACLAAWSRIPPELVLAELQEVLNG
jgi:hypothetical protein